MIIQINDRTERLFEGPLCVDTFAVFVRLDIAQHAPFLSRTQPAQPGNADSHHALSRRFETRGKRGEVHKIFARATVGARVENL